MRHSRLLIISICIFLVLLLTGCNAAETPKATPTFTGGIPELTTPKKFSGVVVYQSDKNGKFQIYTANLATGEIKQLTTEGENIEPTWSPDGSQIAYGCDQGQKFEICIMNADGSNQQQLTHNAVNDFSPDWSRDGSQLVYLSSEVPYSHLTLMNISTGESKRIVTKAGNESSPEFSPDGTQILFASDRDSYFNLFTIHPDGTDEVQITTFGQDDRPSWSPDGKTIVLRRQINDSSVFSGAEIVTIDANGKNDFQLTNDILLEDWPTFSPDGKWILFSGELGSDMQLVIIPINGGLPAPILEGGVFGSAPDWKP